MKGRIKIPATDKRKRLSELLREQGVFLSSPCGDRGICGKCRVRVTEGELFSQDGSPVYPDENGFVLSCRVFCSGGEFEIDTDGGFTFESVSCTNGDVNAALDLGTTTLAMKFVSPEKESLWEISLLNPQRAFGSDVITRIEKSRERLSEMQNCVLGEVKRAAEEFLRISPAAKLRKLTVAGNPTMLHIFCGISPDTLGVYPFTPVFTETKRLTGEDAGLPFDEVILLPSASAFIGSDALCGALVCDMLSLPEPSLLIDVGTNGEIILSTGRKNGNRLFAASAAAGPALEGASISCGVGGVSGGVSRIKETGNGLVFSTVNDEKPVGLCGSGLIDLVACLLEKEIIDETGYMEEDFVLCGSHKTKSGVSLSGTTPISLTQKDVREFQLAKSAIRAGIDVLLNGAGLSLGDVSHVFIAGGLGYYTDLYSAVKTGLLPREFSGKMTAVGNTALSGALLCLDEDALLTLSEITESVTSVELNSSPDFLSLFTEYMTF